MVLVCPPSRSQFKVYVSLTSVTCLFSTKEMRWLKEGQVEGRKWFLCCSGPESQVTCLLKSECMDVKWPPHHGSYGAEAGLSSEYRDSFWIYKIRLYPLKTNHFGFVNYVSFVCVTYLSNTF